VKFNGILVRQGFGLKKSNLLYFLRLFAHYFNRGVQICRNDGLPRLIAKIASRLKYYSRYNAWIGRNEPTGDELERQRLFTFPYQPVISIIVPVFNTPKKYLDDMIRSVTNQSYARWELCIADGGSSDPEVKRHLLSAAEGDPRIKIKLLPENRGIAGNSNEALSLATGDFVALLDHDDLLPPFALFEIAKAVNGCTDADFIYSDEDKISEDGTTRFEPHFKPDWSPDTLRSCNYITHLTVIKKELLHVVGNFREGYEGSQDYDLIVRATEKARHIVHVPKVLYHWRTHDLSAAGRPGVKPYAHDAGRRLLTDHLRREGIEGVVEDGLGPNLYKVTYPVNNDQVISIIIPNKDHAEDLARCITSIMTKSTYRRYEIIIVENESVENTTRTLYNKLQERGAVKIVEWKRPFNFSAMNNHAAKHASGTVLLFLNNDTEVLTSDWIESMLTHAARKEIGAVGPKLLYPDGKIQHAGVILGIQGTAGHSHKYFDRGAVGYFSLLKRVHNVSAVTAACLMMRSDVFEEVGGFDEEFSHSYNDIDLCLRVRQKGYRIIYTPYAELYHFESKSRGYIDSPESEARYKLEAELFTSRWDALLRKGDPYYNVNLTLDTEDYAVRQKDRPDVIFDC
jgi:GT2 family glycosyltransferase